MEFWAAGIYFIVTIQFRMTNWDCKSWLKDDSNPIPNNFWEAFWGLKVEGRFAIHFAQHKKHLWNRSLVFICAIVLKLEFCSCTKFRRGFFEICQAQTLYTVPVQPLDKCAKFKKFKKFTKLCANVQKIIAFWYLNRKMGTNFLHIFSKNVYCAIWNL